MLALPNFTALVFKIFYYHAYHAVFIKSSATFSIEPRESAALSLSLPCLPCLNVLRRPKWS